MTQIDHSIDHITLTICIIVVSFIDEVEYFKCEKRKIKSNSFLLKKNYKNNIILDSVHTDANK